MPSTLAIFTSDPNLLRCQVGLLKERLEPLSEPPRAVGLGYAEADALLLRKKPGSVGSNDLADLVADISSEILFHYAGPPGGAGAFADEDVMPLRFRRWMFMHHGPLASPAATRDALAAKVPAFLARQAKGSTASELCFLAFVHRMRDAGLAEEFELHPAIVGARLAEAARTVEDAERERGKVGSLGFYVTNGRVLAATRLGSGPLHYALLEGIARCPRCGIEEGTSDSNPLLRAHRRVRAVVIASNVLPGSGFIEVPEASVVTVGHNLDVQVQPLARAAQAG